MSDPIKPGAPLASGGMSTEGTTTPVKINKPELDFTDKKVLCSAICKCKSTPGIGKDGRSLKQSCVSGQLKALDGILKHRSPYKPEVNYDMTRQPPAPIMDRNVETKGARLAARLDKNGGMRRMIRAPGDRHSPPVKAWFGGLTW